MLRPSPRFVDATQARRRSLGFTLIELAIVVAIVAILASLGVATYRVYVLKAETAQTLVYYDHIRTVIAIRTDADAETSLERDSVPGAVPPALTGSLDTQEFNGLDGLTFQLIRAPAGTFSSFPANDTYALIATASNTAAVLRLRVLRAMLPFGDGDKVWIQSSSVASAAQLIYPIYGGSATATGNTVAGNGSSTGGSSPTGTPGSESKDTSINVGSGITTGSATPPAGSNSGMTSGSGNASTSTGNTTTSTGTGSSPAGATSSASGVASSGGSSPGSGNPPNTSNPTSSASGNSNITGSGTINGDTWTASAQICIGGAGGGALTGQTNTSAIFQVVTQYANFQVNQMINPTTGCTSYSYGGLPLGSNAQISVVQVVDYNPPNSGSTSTLWDGVKPSLTIKP